MNFHLLSLESLIMRIPKLNSHYKSANYKNHLYTWFVPIKESRLRAPYNKSY